MARDAKSREGGQGNRTDGGGKTKGETHSSTHKGGPSTSNRQTGGSKRHERDDSNGGPDKNTTKKGANSI